MKQKRVEVSGPQGVFAFKYSYIEKGRRDVLEKTLECAYGDTDVLDWQVQCAILEGEFKEPNTFTELSRTEMLLSEIKDLFKTD